MIKDDRGKRGQPEKRIMCMSWNFPCLESPESPCVSYESSFSSCFELHQLTALLEIVEFRRDFLNCAIQWIVLNELHYVKISSFAARFTSHQTSQGPPLFAMVVALGQPSAVLANYAQTLVVVYYKHALSSLQYVAIFGGMVQGLVYVRFHETAKIRNKLPKSETIFFFNMVYHSPQGISKW